MRHAAEQYYQMQLDLDARRAPKPAVALPDGLSVAPQKKYNKIINNSYKNGENLRGDDYHFGTELKVDTEYAGSNLGHVYDAENYDAYKKVKLEVIHLLSANEELIELLSENHKKLNKADVNRMFDIIYSHFMRKEAVRQYANPIYIFDCMTNVTGMKFASMYDMLDERHQSQLLIELNKTHQIFRDDKSDNRLF